ncbi:hypothetical protein llap_21534 [Limosa lapponica baueri]|uniref:Uncharacterized protein n=1 Tax=Limosa lapponica baueri TaxID=1758121 RepID=A0A2I0T321_LIMLA|nr:hypothetical protein llap_21534 [Limosa lapponica baueri]
MFSGCAHHWGELRALQDLINHINNGIIKRGTSGNSNWAEANQPGFGQDVGVGTCALRRGIFNDWKNEDVLVINTSPTELHRIRKSGLFWKRDFSLRLVLPGRSPVQASDSVQHSSKFSQASERL